VLLPYPYRKEQVLAKYQQNYANSESRNLWTECVKSVYRYGTSISCQTNGPIALSFLFRKKVISQCIKYGTMHLYASLPSVSIWSEIDRPLSAKYVKHKHCSDRASESDKVSFY